MKLILGVIDIPYSNNSPARKVAKARPGKSNKPVKAKAGSRPATQTTGDVAGFLERKYGVMQSFVDLHTDDIAKSLENSIAGALESLMMGAPPTLDVFGSAMSAIEKKFKYTYIDGNEINKTGAKGVPTAAALKGVNHRLKLRKGQPRPSFKDTGLYQGSFKAWIE